MPLCPAHLFGEIRLFVTRGESVSISVRFRTICILLAVFSNNKCLHDVEAVDQDCYHRLEDHHNWIHVLNMTNILLFFPLEMDYDGASLL